jgi:basic amino acid/polyamine antiporter, APA family
MSRAGAPDQQRLEPVLGLRHVVAVAMGAMFSSGFFLLPGLAFDEVGPGLPLAYLLAALIVTPAMLAAAELATAIPAAGGPYEFVRHGLGPIIGVAAGIGVWIVMVLKSAFALEGFGTYLDLVIDVPSRVVAAGLAVVLMAVNLRGARESTRAQVALVAVLLAVLAWVISAGVPDTAGALGDGETFRPLLPHGTGGLLAAVGLVFVAFAGLAQSTSLAEETRRPERNLPLGLVVALALTVVVYVVGSMALVATLPANELADDPAPVGSAADVLLGTSGVWMVVLAAGAAFVSTANAGILAGSRYPLALARAGEVPWFHAVSADGVPRRAVMATGAAVLAAVATLDVEELAHLASAAVLVLFALLQVSVVRLRRRQGYRPSFRMPLVPALPAAGGGVAALLVIELGLGPAAFALGAFGGGAAWALLRRRRRQR